MLPRKKDTVVRFSREPPEVTSIIVSNSPIEHTREDKSLGVELNNKLIWNMHVVFKMLNAFTAGFC